MTLLDVYHTWNVLPMSSYMCYLCPQSIQKGAGGILDNPISFNDHIRVSKLYAWMLGLDLAYFLQFVIKYSWHPPSGNIFLGLSEFLYFRSFL